MSARRHRCFNANISKEKFALLKFINENGVSDTHIFVELCAMPDKIPFYEKFGFAANEAQRLRIMYPVEK